MVPSTPAGLGSGALSRGPRTWCDGGGGPALGYLLGVLGLSGAQGLLAGPHQSEVVGSWQRGGPRAPAACWVLSCSSGHPLEPRSPIAEEQGRWPGAGGRGSLGAGAGPVGEGVSPPGLGPAPAGVCAARPRWDEQNARRTRRYWDVTSSTQRYPGAGRAGAG